MVIFVDPFCKPSVICFFIASINSISWIFSCHPGISWTTFHLEVGDDFHRQAVWDLWPPCHGGGWKWRLVEWWTGERVEAYRRRKIKHEEKCDIWRIDGEVGGVGWFKEVIMRGWQRKTWMKGVALEGQQLGRKEMTVFFFEKKNKES